MAFNVPQAGSILSGEAANNLIRYNPGVSYDVVLPDGTPISSYQANRQGLLNQIRMPDGVPLLGGASLDDILSGFVKPLADPILSGAEMGNYLTTPQNQRQNYQSSYLPQDSFQGWLNHPGLRLAQSAGGLAAYGLPSMGLQGGVTNLAASTGLNPFLSGLVGATGAGGITGGLGAFSSSPTQKLASGNIDDVLKGIGVGGLMGGGMYGLTKGIGAARDYLANRNQLGSQPTGVTSPNSNQSGEVPRNTETWARNEYYKNVLGARVKQGASGTDLNYANDFNDQVARVDAALKDFKLPRNHYGISDLSDRLGNLRENLLDNAASKPVINPSTNVAPTLNDFVNQNVDSFRVDLGLTKADASQVLRSSLEKYLHPLENGSPGLTEYTSGDIPLNTQDLATITQTPKLGVKAFKSMVTKGGLGVGATDLADSMAYDWANDLIKQNVPGYGKINQLFSDSYKLNQGLRTNFNESSLSQTMNSTGANIPIVSDAYSFAKPRLLYGGLEKVNELVHGGSTNPYIGQMADLEKSIASGAQIPPDIGQITSGLATPQGVPSAPTADMATFLKDTIATKKDQLISATGDIAKTLRSDITGLQKIADKLKPSMATPSSQGAVMAGLPNTGTGSPMLPFSNVDDTAMQLADKLTTKAPQSGSLQDIINQAKGGAQLPPGRLPAFANLGADVSVPGSQSATTVTTQSGPITEQLYNLTQSNASPADIQAFLKTIASPAAAQGSQDAINAINGVKSIYNVAPAEAAKFGFLGKPIVDNLSPERLKEAFGPSKLPFNQMLNDLTKTHPDTATYQKFLDETLVPAAAQGSKDAATTIQGMRTLYGVVPTVPGTFPAFANMGAEISAPGFKDIMPQTYAGVQDLLKTLKPIGDKLKSFDLNSNSNTMAQLSQYLPLLTSLAAGNNNQMPSPQQLADSGAFTQGIQTNTNDWGLVPGTPTDGGMGVALPNGIRQQYNPATGQNMVDPRDQSTVDSFLGSPQNYSQQPAGGFNQQGAFMDLLSKGYNPAQASQQVQAFATGMGFGGSGKQMAPAQLSQIASINTALQQLDDFNSGLSQYGNRFGNVQGGPIGQFIGTNLGLDPVQGQVSTALQGLTQSVGQALQGGKLSSLTLPMYQKMMPDMTMDQPIVQGKLSELRNQLIRKLQMIQAGYGAGGYDTQSSNLGDFIDQYAQ